MGLRSVSASKDVIGDPKPFFTWRSTRRGSKQKTKLRRRRSATISFEFYQKFRIPFWRAAAVWCPARTWGRKADRCACLSFGSSSKQCRRPFLCNERRNLTQPVQLLNINTLKAIISTRSTLCYCLFPSSILHQGRIFQGVEGFNPPPLHVSTPPLLVSTSHFYIFSHVFCGGILNLRFSTSVHN